MNPKKFYITTPIYYINDIPHIGHTCTTVAADILARFHRQKGDDVFFLTGTDEHGQKVAEAAEKEGLNPQEYCDKIAPRYQEAWEKLNISFDYFIRTTNPGHEKVVADVLNKIYQAGDVYKAKYEGWYCIGCESFKTETELVDGHCPLHPPEKTVWQSEENWFFKLSKYVPKLIGLIENNETNYVFPAGKRAEVLAKLRADVKDISISREKVKWGILAPWDKNHTIYVWIDALINYYSATRFVEGKGKYWPADLHLLGKEILWFHTVIWQAMLLSAGLELPNKAFIHSFYIIDGQKMSKSLGNVISPQQLVDLFGVDGARYLVAKSFPAENDTDIGIERFKETYNADLANNLGNLVSRVTKLAGGLTYKTEEITVDDEFNRLIDEVNFESAIGYVFQKIIDPTNQKLNQVKPWLLAPNDEKRQAVLKEAVTNLRKVAYLLQPIIPDTCDNISAIFEGEIKSLDKPLFPRINKLEIPEEKLVVGEIVKIEKHPDADKLVVVTVNIGKNEPVVVVTGAGNIVEGDIVPVVLPGGEVNKPDGGKTKINKGKLRGVMSYGMLASALELGVGRDHEGIYVLDKNLKDKVGQGVKKFV